jgi:hypothetical protein
MVLDDLTIVGWQGLVSDSMGKNYRRSGEGTSLVQNLSIARGTILVFPSVAEATMLAKKASVDRGWPSNTGETHERSLEWRLTIVACAFFLAQKKKKWYQKWSHIV